MLKLKACATGAQGPPAFYVDQFTVLYVKLKSVSSWQAKQTQSALLLADHTERLVSPAELGKKYGISFILILCVCMCVCGDGHVCRCEHLCIHMAG